MTADRMKEAARYLAILLRVEHEHALTDRPLPELEGLLAGIDRDDLRQLAAELDSERCGECGSMRLPEASQIVREAAEEIVRLNNVGHSVHV